MKKYGTHNGTVNMAKKNIILEVHISVESLRHGDIEEGCFWSSYCIVEEWSVNG